MKNRLLNEYGYIQVRKDIGVKPKHRKSDKLTTKQKLEISVCCNCTKPKCNGSAECMRKQMRKDTL